MPTLWCIRQALMDAADVFFRLHRTSPSALQLFAGGSIPPNIFYPVESKKIRPYRPRLLNPLPHFLSKTGIIT